MSRRRTAPGPKHDPLWYKDAIIYQLHVKAFYDSNGDGMGDFAGLGERLDYVRDLGVNTIWLLPFYPSPMRDDGYDIADYRQIHQSFGSLRDFRGFIDEAHKRDLRVITELVINHTSDQHPWFQAARRARPGSAKRDWYVWSETDRKWPETRIIFTDTETSNWAWDPLARAYYWHRFFSHQPDLNFDNPRVVNAVIRVMRYWLDQGVDGFRLDAIPYLIERDGTNNENLAETHRVIRKMRRVVDEHYDDRMFLAEANQWPEDVREYFGDNDECHMAYNFPLMPRMYMAVAQEDRHPIVEIMRQTPHIPDECQWAIFLRNHDELTLEMVTDRERDYMYSQYGSDPRMRVNVGIRRRLAPLLENDIDKIKLMNSLLMSMPGSPIIYYGDEIGMGDNIFLGDRNGVRTPMQWSPDRNAGFSKADPQRLYLPPIMDPIYGYEAVNVESQARDPSSLLNWMRRLISVRRSHKAFGRGMIEFLRPGNRKVLAYVRRFEDEIVLCVANLSRSAQPVELDLVAFRGRVPVEMMGHTTFPPIGDLPYLLTLPRHGVYWFRLAVTAEVPEWHEGRLRPIELPVLVLADGWDTFFPDRVDASRRGLALHVREQIEREILPAHLPTQRWFGAKQDRIDAVRLDEFGEWSFGNSKWLIALLDVRLAGGATETYFLPLSLAWGEDEEQWRRLLPVALGKVRHKARVGILYDAFADPAFLSAVTHAMCEETVAEPGNGTLEFTRTQAFDTVVGTAVGEYRIRRPPVEGTNSAAILDERLFLKGYRRLQAGTHPEVEIGRFLTDVAYFPCAVPTAGALEFAAADGKRYAVAMLQGFVENQGDAWTYTVDHIVRYLESAAFRHDEDPPVADSFAERAALLGRRTAEMHRAFAQSTGDAAFDPEPMSQRHLAVLKDGLEREAHATYDLLHAHVDALPHRARSIAGELLDKRSRTLSVLRDLAPAKLEKAALTRHHGDFHLGQILITRNDFVIVDFEGEPARPLEERRAKQSPLRDVAGMVRSVAYASHVALDRVTSDRTDEQDKLVSLAGAWQRRIENVFIDAYVAAMAGEATFPVERDARRLIRFFTLEKALYEVRYELGNRPDWVHIPLTGLRALLTHETAAPGPGTRTAARRKRSAQPT
jgi:maltose alpha-D-glucosyltransferase/alpha-amylase